MKWISASAFAAVNKQQSVKYEAPLDELTRLALAPKRYTSQSMSFLFFFSYMKMNCFHGFSSEASFFFHVEL